MRPANAVAYEPIDLKLGIKSSLPQVKSTLALLYLIWECEERPDTIIYADEDGDNLVLKPDIEQHLFEKLSSMGIVVSARQFHTTIGQNCLLKSQLESLIVAFELIWKVARVRFAGDYTNSAERTGQKRYQKQVWFTCNMDLLGAVADGNAPFTQTLFSWLGLDIQKDTTAEKTLIKVLTVLSEGAVFKLLDGTNDVIFNLESLYNTMLNTEQAVDVLGDAEAKGSLRILKSALSEGVIDNISYNGGMVTPVDRSELERYFGRVMTLHQMTTKVPGDVVPVVAVNDVHADEPISEYNILLYGVPGCGKSHEIKTHYCDDEDRMERVVFHPDYTYSDFVGQIMPSSDDEGRISYPFVPGPFTRILKKAVEHPETNFFLIIEEINRGNAPAIFGEVFQLLDRERGESEYGISNVDIAKSVYGEGTHMVKIPANLFVLATMNTADQNVFTLDTAFKRRWAMKSIPNNFATCILKDVPICDSDISWQGFAETINDLIIEYGEGNLGSEDRRLGAYFVKEAELRDSKLFGEKVLMYLWNDAFKYDHDKVFKAEYKTLEQLLRGFEQSLFDVFVETIDFPHMAVAMPLIPAETTEEQAEGDE